MLASSIPVITLDGPSGVGKGTISALLAQQLNWHYLDSGALYRLTALACAGYDVSRAAAQEVAAVAASLDVLFQPDGKILLNAQEVSAQIRTEFIAGQASELAALPLVREALVARQKAFLQMPGLIADGRDMGTMIFPDARLKIFLTASPDERAKRRYKQLIEKGNSVKIADLVNDIRERDERDMKRTISPLKPAQDAHIIDTSELTIDEVFEKVLKLYQACL